MHTFNTTYNPNQEEIIRLRKDLDASRKMELKLWVAVAYLQQSVGVATGYINNDEVPSDVENFFDPSLAADRILNGIISLTPEE